MVQKICVVLFFLTCVFFSVANCQVLTGLDELVANKYSQLKGKKVGFIANKTSVTSSGEFAPSLFTKQKVCKLVALFSPEHGFLGERKAGVKSDVEEKYEGVPVYSLYGTTRKPTKKMLSGITTLVFDIQDIGLRPYTYLSTMIYTMEAAAENNIEFVVLDRPNPLSGERIEGNIIDTSLISFVGVIPIPYLHGMTLGELAQMAKGERWFRGAEKLKLSVINMSGWKRKMYWSETGLKWIPPSPNIPTSESAVGCAMLGAIGELGNLSVGIGSDLPFQRIGSKLVQPQFLEQAVQSSLPKGILAKREDYTVPFADSSKTFLGMRIELPKNISSVDRLYGFEFSILKKLLADSVFAKSFRALPMSTQKMFEKVTGVHNFAQLFTSDKVTHTLAADGSSHITNQVEGEMAYWYMDESFFRTTRKKYLLYN